MFLALTAEKVAGRSYRSATIGSSLIQSVHSSVRIGFIYSYRRDRRNIPGEARVRRSVVIGGEPSDSSPTQLTRMSLRFGASYRRIQSGGAPRHSKTQARTERDETATSWSAALPRRFGCVGRENGTTSPDRSHPSGSFWTQRRPVLSWNSFLNVSRSCSLTSDTAQ